MPDLFLGIDTSNYRTSVALVDNEGKMIFNHRELLKVPEGERGMRQSQAFFNHVQRLPEVMKQVMEYRESIRLVSVSERPRPREGSYMPCFTAGTACASEIASALGVTLFRTSHQEGHIEAVKFYSPFKDDDDVLFFHFSGGTTEAVYTGEIVGGTLDLSAYLKPIKVKDGYMNLSGIETQSVRKAEELLDSDESTDPLVRELFDKMGKAVSDMTLQLTDKFGRKPVLFAGGVSSSEYLRKYIDHKLGDRINYVFGAPELSGDNAVGVALIGMKNYYSR